MTPAIKLLQQAKVSHRVHEYQHDEEHESFGLEAAEKLHLPAAQVFKTLVVKLDNGQLAVAIVPVDKMLSLKSIARVMKVKKATMADKQEVQRSTGYVLGGVSPLAQKKRLATVIDSQALQFASIYVSGGRRGLEIEIAAKDLATVSSSQFADIAV